MNQSEIVNRLITIFPKILGIDAAVLYGSLARKEATPNSDIDIQIITNDHFDSNLLKEALLALFDKDVLAIQRVELRTKLVVYFKKLPKVEFAFCKNLNEMTRNYIGSEIKNPKQTILFERQPSETQLELFLVKAISAQENEGIEKQISGFIEKFIYEFESCSNMHRRSDGYQFYYFYNIALHVATQLRHLSNKHYRFVFLPKYFLSNSISNDEQAEFYELNGTIFLPKANLKKRKLLNFFYDSVVNLVDKNKYTEIKTLCEYFYQRDYFWNFRDISTYNSLIKPNVIFRTATMSVFENELEFEKLLATNKIKTVIDLRSDREIEEKPYSANSLTRFNYVKAQLDPWNQPEWFKKEHHYGTNEEIAYRYFAIGCREKIKLVFEAILNERKGAVAIHCFAGKDRTGIVVSMMHLLIGSCMNIIETDYLASEVDVKLHRLKLVLDIINNEGGIESYLKNCGLTNNQIIQLKRKLRKDE